MTHVLIRSAAATDLPAVLALLNGAGLPGDVEVHFSGFLVAEGDSGFVLGAVGVESYGRDALLRSLVITAESDATGLGEVSPGRCSPGSALAHSRASFFSRWMRAVFSSGSGFATSRENQRRPRFERRVSFVSFAQRPRA